MSDSHPIIVTGFMGSGKTTVAQALSRLLECEMIDLDRYITERIGRSPREIIEQDGVAAFREIETRLLRELLSERAACVIALGGGAWTIRTNRDLIADHNGFVAWLDAPFALCWQRIIAGGRQRPLARSEEQARELFEQRRPIYELAALRVAVGGKGVDECALLIAGHLSNEEISGGPQS